MCNLCAYFICYIISNKVNLMQAVWMICNLCAYFICYIISNKVNLIQAAYIQWSDVHSNLIRFLFFFLYKTYRRKRMHSDQWEKNWLIKIIWRILNCFKLKKEEDDDDEMYLLLIFIKYAEAPGIQEYLNESFKMKIVVFLNRRWIVDFSKNLRFTKIIIFI